MTGSPISALPRNAPGKIHKPTLRKNFGSPAPLDIGKTAASSSFTQPNSFVSHSIVHLHSMKGRLP